MYYQAGLLLCLSAFLAWRYSKTSVDPDWAYFNLYAFTGSLYGRDFADCKTPGVHIWYWLLAKVAGLHVERIKFLNHFLVGVAGVLLLPNFPAALAYTLLVNSGWLLAFHGNVGQVPAALIVLAFVANPLAASMLWLFATFYEPKLAPSFLAVAVIQGWVWLILPALLCLGVLIVYRNSQWFKWLWESSVIIPARIGTTRNQETWFPWFTSNPVLYVLPWVMLGVYYKPDFLFWLPPLLYVVFVALGKAIRSNHLIPLVPWFAMADIPMVFVVGLVVMDMISSGFYFGDLWLRYYPALAKINDEAKTTGEWLRDKAGTLYVNSIQSAVYVYARKPLSLGMTEQIEIREVAKERRERMAKRWRETPPDWVVCGDVPGIVFKPIGYQKVASVGENMVYKKGVYNV